jgi:hypothetical protein
VLPGFVGRPLLDGFRAATKLNNIRVSTIGVRVQLRGLLDLIEQSMICYFKLRMALLSRLVTTVDPPKITRLNPHPLYQ